MNSFRIIEIKGEQTGKKRRLNSKKVVVYQKIQGHRFRLIFLDDHLTRGTYKCDLICPIRWDIKQFLMMAVFK